MCLNSLERGGKKLWEDEWDEEMKVYYAAVGGQDRSPSKVTRTAQKGLGSPPAYPEMRDKIKITGLQGLKCGL